MQFLERLIISLTNSQILEQTYIFSNKRHDVSNPFIGDAGAPGCPGAALFRMGEVPSWGLRRIATVGFERGAVSYGQGTPAGRQTTLCP